MGKKKEGGKTARENFLRYTTGSMITVPQGLSGRDKKMQIKLFI